MTDQKYHAAVLGSPIAHSKSPAMHQAAYEYLQAPIDYDRFEVAEDKAAEFFASLDQRFGSRRRLVGFSVTMPLKAVLVPHMDDLSTRVQRLGVLNTVVFDKHGAACGYNTDVDGVRLALAQAGFTSADGGSMGILGAGGTATAAVAAAADMGLTQVVLYVRDPQRAQDALEVAEYFGLVARVKRLETFVQSVAHHAAVVATLPAHAADSLATELPSAGLPPLLDVIYDPWPTALAAAWQATGAQVASGLDMLLYQGVEQAKLFIQKVVANPETIDWDIATHHMAAALALDVS
ncbi:MAG TPA: shikimate dehydrogenase [Enteractinococcus helveticum]|uniref:Shikimate dehydrogenase n=1 Tax=Enteractinococcus helveticum TaxID=1837282 RepID=A0A921FMQ7_9MICC|nr:shikimate dehydrogenase [Enteractinococcus helveticum]HJF14127.1 shikimate dehydrogenase [Enteractinococcus helveticum]